jgi:folate-binding protein YgfZ
MAATFNPFDGAFLDLSTRVKIRVSGTDRLRFLNGQITNDVRKATPGGAIAACVLNAKGRLDAHLLLSIDSDAFVIDSDPELRETLQPRLERYVIADDVELEDLSDRLSIFHVLAETPPDLPDNCRTVSANRFQKAGWDIWVNAVRRDELFTQLSANLAFCDADCAEVFRIEMGVPRWGRELTSEIIPVEADLEDSCIDYEKGCYIGQEIVSRMRMSGQRNKRLCGLVPKGDRALVPGMRLTTDGKEVGWITSATKSERLGKEIALGYVKRGTNAAGSELSAVEGAGAGNLAASRATIVDLPFA